MIAYKIGIYGNFVYDDDDDDVADDEGSPCACVWVLALLTHSPESQKMMKIHFWTEKKIFMWLLCACRTELNMHKA